MNPHTRRATLPRSDVPLIAQRLRFYRVRAGLSQSELAQRARLNHSYFSRLESGGRAPSTATLARIAAVLGLTPGEQDDLLLAAGYGPASAVLAELLAAMLACDDPARHRLAEQVLLTACAIFRGEAA